eukprot:gene17249-biopygen26145
MSLCLTERFSKVALGHVIDHWSSWSFRPETDKSTSLDAIRRYYAASNDDGSFSVKYSQKKHGKGRLFARGGMSMQGMVREVRNAIAHPFYTDLDFVNCHPSILMQRCEQRGIGCPLLKQYCKDRSTVLQDLSVDVPSGKTAVLAAMNGGMDLRQSSWLSEFHIEMKRVAQELLMPGSIDHSYIEIARKDRNTYGSALNLMLCDVENACLMALKEFLEHKLFTIGVLMFDGAMVEKTVGGGDNISDTLLEEASHYIFSKTGYRLVVKTKEMTASMLDLPASVFMGRPTPPPRYAGGDNDAARHILNDLKGMIVESNGCVFIKKSNIWTSNKDDVDTILLRTCIDANIRFVDDTGVSRKYSCMYSKAHNIVKSARALVYNTDPCFGQRLWESNLGVICFRNGVYTFADSTFAPFSERPDVLPVIFISRDFPLQKPPREFMDTVRSKVLVSTLGCDERVDSYLQMLARAMAGKHTDKNWGIMIGERNSGKGLLQALNERAWGPYVNTIDSSVLMLNGLSTDVKSQGWMIDCEFTRQTYTNEIKVDPGNRNIKLDGSLIKKFQSGGDVLKARRNYENERSLKTATRLFMNLNDLRIYPRSPDDNKGEWMPFYQEADDDLKDGFCARADVIDAFAWLVLDAFEDHKLRPSTVVKNDTLKLKVDEGDELSIIQYCFKVTNALTDFLKLSDVNSFAKEHKLNKRSLHYRLEKMGAVLDPSCSIDGVKQGRCFRKLQIVSPS